jgi:DNA-directed RNA polymerase subunit RPC12/RpoP
METVTADLANFGYRQLDMAGDLLKAIEKGLPDDFDDDGLTIMLNTHSGYVFLTNNDYQVAMLNGSKLESFYTCPNCGNEGFAEDILTESGNCNECNEKVRY